MNHTKLDLNPVILQVSAIRVEIRLNFSICFMFALFLVRMADDEVFEPPDDGSANYTRIEADRIQPGSYGEPDHGCRPRSPSMRFSYVL